MKFPVTYLPQNFYWVEYESSPPTKAYFLISKETNKAAVIEFEVSYTAVGWNPIPLKEFLKQEELKYLESVI